ncbi:MAG: DsbA family oxidoreductase [Egibacteraceae bacterium]
MTIAVTPGTIVLFSDLTCPFAHVAVHRLFKARARLGMDGEVSLDHHAFPLELVNKEPGTRHGSDSEVPVLGALEPDAGWQLWQGPDYHYPSTVLLGFEAVAAAKAQGLRASEDLDRALRRAFWAQSRHIGHYHTILEVAATVEGLDAGRLAADLSSGTARRAIFDDYATVQTGAVALSPHLFLPDGSNLPNPGMTVRWQGEWARGFPVVERDDPTVYEQVVTAAARA